MSNHSLGWFGFLASKGDHYQVTVTSYVCSRKAPRSMDVNFRSEAHPHQDVINLVVVLSILSVSCPSSGWFVGTKGVCQYWVVLRLLSLDILDLSH